MRTVGETKRHFSTSIATALVTIAGLTLSASAQSALSGMPDEGALKPPPFESTVPGQSKQANLGDPSRSLVLGELHWAPIESQCGFTGGTDAAPVMKTEKAQPLVFVTMASPTGETTPPLERGYIMANGIVRELERGKSAPNKQGTVITVWRSAGEPRINVSVAISETKQTENGVEYIGSMTVHWGDKKEDVEIQGRCAEQHGASSER
ncbi:hypothetical protein U0C82_00385 [Fulvimarina sp. 2208YS6-2-32]|uniref:Uncharacterized protein n=1 Tax=Fulvimarina uroteuthidis TaxID=3098149 RepID=A0ABU5HYE2_9HYPH|nr:hypothetical protein [Fulvimarina sp. 2208YS6-2-32]MDY8107604.1 hypothetical protein [Fulvimarina sp. 2208YS6-2-32]